MDTPAFLRHRGPSPGHWGWMSMSSLATFEGSYTTDEATMEHSMRWDVKISRFQNKPHVHLKATTTANTQNVTLTVDPSSKEHT